MIDKKIKKNRALSAVLPSKISNESLFLLFCATIGLCVLGGCARNISSSSYSARKLSSSSRTYECTIVSVRKVRVEEGDYLEDNKTGATMGLVGGAALGSMIGGGNARIATGALGGLAGAVGGAMIEREMKSQDGLEYVVRLRSGQLRTVVQGLDNPLYRGQRALLIEEEGGRARVVPAGY